VIASEPVAVTATTHIPSAKAQRASDAQVKGQRARCKSQNAWKPAAAGNLTASEPALSEVEGTEAGSEDIFAEATILYACRPEAKANPVRSRRCCRVYPGARRSVRPNRGGD